MAMNWARLLVFGSSAAVLVLEILAGRLMAPYIGVTLETFTGIIGVVLAGIAAGAWAGGRAADRIDARVLLGPLLVASGVLVLAAPALVDLVGPSMRAAGPIEIATLTASAFFLPALTLSSVPPIVVKARLRSLEKTGSVVGSFSAVGTLGALAGTFVTGFVLLAAMPSRSLVFAVGASLLVVGAPMAARAAPVRVVGGGLLLAISAAIGLVLVPQPCDHETTYFCAVVEADPRREDGRVLVLDTLRHSYVRLSDPTYLDFEYARVMADVLAELPGGSLSAAYIGGGGFTLPRYVAAIRPGSTATVFEIDGKLVKLAQAELGVVLSEELQVEVGDARLLLPDTRSDSVSLVIGDAFGGLSVPWHLTTREFLVDIDRVLAPSGVYMMNLIDHPPLGFAKAEVATFLDVFEHVAVIALPGQLAGERGGNYVLVGSQQPVAWPIVQAWISSRGSDEVVWAGEQAAAFAGTARMLTDDFAPVDQLISRP